MADSDKTIEILKDIRDELRGVRGEVRELRADSNQRVDTNNHRLDLVATTLLDLAGQNRLIVRYTKALAERPDALESRSSRKSRRMISRTYELTLWTAAVFRLSRGRPANTPRAATQPLGRP